MKSVFAFIVCVWFAQSTEAQVTGSGKCPNIAAIQYFIPNVYLGKWYEYARYNNVAETGTKCVSITYDPSETLGVINVESVGYKLGGKKVTIKGTAKPVNTSDIKGIFKVKFNTDSSEATHYVIGSDYESYAVVWSCRNVGASTNSQQVWILTRERKPSNIVIEEAYAALTRNNLSTSKLSVVDQNNCAQYESS